MNNLLKDYKRAVRKHDEARAVEKMYVKKIEQLVCDQVKESLQPFLFDKRHNGYIYSYDCFDILFSGDKIWVYIKYVLTDKEGLTRASKKYIKETENSHYDSKSINKNFKVPAYQHWGIHIKLNDFLRNPKYAFNNIRF